jgi:putative tryptophan/tyrosine transport system substrate-binding protein
MERRAFILATISGGLLTAPLAAQAQQAGKVYRLGILSPTAPPAPSDRAVTSLLVPAVLREMGYVEGQNLVVERRYADNQFARLPDLARQLVELRMDVILAVGNDAPGAARDVSTTIPIVMLGRDPVKLGYVASLARPGGNITGVVISETGLADKRLELLREAVPTATRIALLASGDIGIKGQVQEAERAAASLGLTLLVVDVRNRDYESAFAKIAADRANALFVPSSPILNVDRKQIIALAAKRRLPAIYQWREHAAEGGLMAYGSNLSLLSRQVASYIDRIFKGANPAELPLEQPTAYELTINLRTAKALALTIPPSLLHRADQVIE